MNNFSNLKNNLDKQIFEDNSNLLNLEKYIQNLRINNENKINSQLEKLKIQNSNNLKNDNLEDNLIIKNYMSNKTQKTIINNKNQINNGKKNNYLTSGVRYDNNYKENEFAMGEINKNNCFPECLVKINKTNPISKIQNEKIENLNQIELFNQQLANMQKDIMINNIKQNKLSQGTKIMFDNEKLHAEEAMESGIYVTWCSKDVKIIKLIKLHLNTIFIYI